MEAIVNYSSDDDQDDTNFEISAQQQQQLRRKRSSSSNSTDYENALHADKDDEHKWALKLKKSSQNRRSNANHAISESSNSGSNNSSDVAEHHLHQPLAVGAAVKITSTVPAGASKTTITGKRSLSPLPPSSSLLPPPSTMSSQQTTSNRHTMSSNVRYSSNSSTHSSGKHKDENVSKAAKSVASTTRRHEHERDGKASGWLGDDVVERRNSHKYERDYVQHGKSSKGKDYRHDERRKPSSSSSSSASVSALQYNKERYRSGEESRRSREHAGGVTSRDGAGCSSRKGNRRYSATYTRNSQHNDKYAQQQVQQQQQHQHHYHYNQSHHRHHRSYDERSVQRRQHKTRSRTPRSRSGSRSRTRSRTPTAATRLRRRDRVRARETRSRSYTRSPSRSHTPDKRQCTAVAPKEVHHHHHQHQHQHHPHQQHQQQQQTLAIMGRSRPTSYAELNSHHDAKNNQTSNTVPVVPSNSTLTSSLLTDIQKAAAAAAAAATTAANTTMTAAATTAPATAATPHIPALMSLMLPHKYQAKTLTGAVGNMSAGASFKTSAVSINSAAAAGLGVAGVPAVKAPVQLPSYYNPSVINATKYAEQAQKRKLLWGSKKSVDAAGKWDNAQFSQDSDGKVASKFMRLMGIKNAAGPSGNGNAAGESGEHSAGGAHTKTDAQCAFPSKNSLGNSSNNSGNNKNTVAGDVQSREQMFSSMEKQYEVARQATHTMRGVGLGFSTQPRTF